MSCASTRSTEPDTSFSASMPSGATFAFGIRFVAVTRGRAGFHRRQAAHAAILFVKFAADLHHFARRFGAAGENAAANHRVRQRQRFDDVAGFRDAAIGENGDAFLLRRCATPRISAVICGMPTPATMRVVQIEPGPWPTLMAFAPHSARNSTPAALVTLPAMIGSFGKRIAQHSHRVAHAFAMAVRGGNGDDVHAAFHQSADVRQDAFAIQFAEGIARGGNGRAADQTEIGVARRLELRVAFLGDALDVAHREQPVQPVLVIHDQQLVDAGMLGEKFVRARNRISAQLLFVDGLDLGARGQRLGPLCVLA